MGLIQTILFFFAALSSCFAIPLIQEMTLEEKVGQLLMAHFRGETTNEETTRLLQNAHVGALSTTNGPTAFILLSRSLI